MLIAITFTDQSCSSGKLTCVPQSGHSSFAVELQPGQYPNQRQKSQKLNREIMHGRIPLAVYCKNMHLCVLGERNHISAYYAGLLRGLQLDIHVCDFIRLYRD